MTNWLFEVRATDPVTFAAVPGLILLIGLAACLIPAWRATRVDPIKSLRDD
jgi:ABC-type antimicrobial peptide transport system permease subunit